MAERKEKLYLNKRLNTEKEIYTLFSLFPSEMVTRMSEPINGEKKVEWVYIFVNLFSYLVFRKVKCWNCSYRSRSLQDFKHSIFLC